MKLLCLDTSTDACSVALAIDGAMFREYADEPRVHARRVLAMVDAVLSRAATALESLDAIAVGTGPGSFTGVRIGCSVVQGLAFAAGRPVLALSSLAVLAARYVEEDAGPDGIVVVAQDARMGEVYWSAYRAGGGPASLLAPLVPDRVDPPAAVPGLLAAVTAAPVLVAAGSALGAPPGDLAAGLGARRAEPRALPCAGDAIGLAAALLRSGGGLPPERAVPVYFRSPV